MSAHASKAKCAFVQRRSLAHGPSPSYEADAVPICRGFATLVFASPGSLALAPQWYSQSHRMGPALVRSKLLAPLSFLSHCAHSARAAEAAPGAVQGAGPCRVGCVCRGGAWQPLGRFHGLDVKWVVQRSLEPGGIFGECADEVAVPCVEIKWGRSANCPYRRRPPALHWRSTPNQCRSFPQPLVHRGEGECLTLARKTAHLRVSQGSESEREAQCAESVLCRSMRT